MLLFSATCTYGPRFCWAVHNNFLRQNCWVVIGAGRCLGNTVGGHPNQVCFQSNAWCMKVTNPKQWRAVGFCSLWGAYLRSLGTSCQTPYSQNSAARTSSVNVHCLCPYVPVSLLRWAGSTPAKIRNIDQKIPWATDSIHRNETDSHRRVIQYCVPSDHRAIKSWCTNSSTRVAVTFNGHRQGTRALLPASTWMASLCLHVLPRSQSDSVLSFVIIINFDELVEIYFEILWRFWYSSMQVKIDSWMKMTRSSEYGFLSYKRYSEYNTSSRLF